MNSTFTNEIAKTFLNRFYFKLLNHYNPLLKKSVIPTVPWNPRSRLKRTCGVIRYLFLIIIHCTFEFNTQQLKCHYIIMCGFLNFFFKHFFNHYFYGLYIHSLHIIMLSEVLCVHIVDNIIQINKKKKNTYFWRSFRVRISLMLQGSLLLKSNTATLVVTLTSNDSDGYKLITHQNIISSIKYIRILVFYIAS